MKLDDLDGNSAALKKYEREQDARRTMDDRIQDITMVEIWEAIGEVSGKNMAKMVEAVRLQDSLEVGSVVMDVIEEYFKEAP